MARSMYEVRLKEVRENYSANSRSLSVRIPTFLYDEWKKRKGRGDESPMSQILAQALHFALYGPHPFSDSLAGLADAFEKYELADMSERQALEHIVKKMLAQDGYTIEIKPIVPDV